MDQQSLLVDYLYLVEFTYNNGYNNSIGMAPFQVLYGCFIYMPLSWDSLEDHILLGLEMLRDMEQ